STLRGLLSKPDPHQRSDQDRLKYHLSRYTAENTRDFFVHKDLAGFLQRELDYYLKNEVLRLDDVDLDDLTTLRRAGARSKTIRTIADKIITFLDQLESFQRRLFLKRKFVLQSDYCLTLDKIPLDVRADFYPEILSNENQLEEWQKLYSLKVSQDTNLDLHPHLMLDTVFFDTGFKSRLLAQFDDIEAALDGLLIQGENYQALKLLHERYEGEIDCIHIDPPYNTQTSGFLYKNSYQHSSWLSMMENRIEAGIRLLAPTGDFQCHIDENEYERLQLLLETLNLPSAGTVVWDKKNPMLGRKGIATQHEYIIWRTAKDSSVYVRPVNARRILTKAKQLIEQYGEVNDKVQSEFSTWISRAEGLSGGERAYRLIDAHGRVHRGVAMGAPEYRTDPKFHIPLIHPETGKPCPIPSNGWSRSPETLKELLDKDEILFGSDETTQPTRKVYLNSDKGRQLSSVIRSASRGKDDLQSLGLDFPYSHPTYLYEELIGASVDSDVGVVLDFFAGSGTTAHAVININADDGSEHRYILIEMGDHFDTVLKPRIQRIAYTQDWKNGKPIRPKGGQQELISSGQSHMFQYIRLESYDDTFHNIHFRETQAPLLDLTDYHLSYFLDHETTGSPTLLDVEQFERPFEYKLNVTGPGGVLAPRSVDLVTTFNFLIGLTVHTIRHFQRNE
ncbi:MAG: site-specific DNA-methyltransferase, partial [Anaerolineales bacterium]|nr:site-specific DNA-methyltransferase [Anaerolineales bacterium]